MLTDRIKRLLNGTDSKAILVAASAAALFQSSPAAFAQGFSTASSTNTANSLQNTSNIGQVLLAQAPARNTIIPTDVEPLPSIQARSSFAENFQLRILQRLPSRFYFSSSCETSLRYETNPFQFPTKRQMLRQLPSPAIIRQLNSFQQATILNTLGLVNNDDMIFRILPNVTGGWTVTPRTRVFANYFMIRDELFHNVRLNTVIHSIAGGVQHDFPITSRGNLQAEFQFRELYQLHQEPVFDYLPGLTFSYVLTPRTVAFVNGLLQLRGKRPFQAPTREIDPFYTWGLLYQRNGWTFSASSTFVQNFRQPFRRDASIPINNYSFILDFEIARRIIRELPGLQAFVRAEPIYNFHSNKTPGLSGMDFRLFFGLRMAVSKPALTATLDQLRQQLEEQEAPPGPNGPAEEEEKTNTPKPSAYLMPYQLIADREQPIHGVLPETTNLISQAPAVEEKPVKVRAAKKPKAIAHKEPKQHIAEAPKVKEPKVKEHKKEEIKDSPKQIAALPPQPKEAKVKEAEKPKEKANKNKPVEMVLVPPFPEASAAGIDGALVRSSVLSTVR